MIPPPIPPTPPKQLNPTAPNFKGILPWGEKKSDKTDKEAVKEAKKAEKITEKKAKAEKAARKKEEKALVSESATESGTASPMDPRRSRDNRSISTAAEESTSSPRESLERLASETLSESQPTSSIGKESFMQKLSRKSSSGKFFPGFGKDKASLFTSTKKASEVGTPDETDEDGAVSNTTMAKSVESVSSSPLLGSGIKDNRSSGLSWSSIKRMGKRGDKTPSLHESIASETTGDEDDAYTPLQEGIVVPSG
jgi:hypothetical protein